MASECNITSERYCNNAVFHANYSINSVTTSDSGTYTCNATNPIGNNSTTITVVIGKLLIICDLASKKKHIRGIGISKEH